MICEAIAVPRRRPRVDIFPSAFPSEVTTYYTLLIVQFSKIISFKQTKIEVSCFYDSHSLE